MSALAKVDRNISILIVDDYSAMRKIMQNCLKQLGFENVTEATDGAEALQKLEGGRFEFVISDWHMPNMMGIELLKAIRSDDNLKTIPFLMVAPEAQKEGIPEAARAGMSNFIVKPFTADTLSSKMEAIFSRLGQR